MLAEKAATTSGAAQPLDAEQVVRLGLTHVVSHRPVDESTAFDRHVRPGLAVATHTHSGPRLFVCCGKTGVRQDAALNRKIANALCAIAEIYMTDLW